MIRLLLSLVLCAAALASAQDGTHDPAFEGIAFEKWIARQDRGTIRINLSVSQTQLSHQQRPRLSLLAGIDSKELVRRPANGEWAFFVQLSDREGRRYQTHNSIDMRDIEKHPFRADLGFTQSALLAPGDYRLDVAVVHTGTGDHGLAHKTLRFNALSDDPLPAAARDFPSVEFFGETTPPDRWFLPSIKSRLNLPLATTRPIRVELLVNGTRHGTRWPYDAVMTSLIPAMKSLTQIELRNGTLDLSLFDLERQRVSFTQNNVRDVDWPRLREALAEADPNMIDVQSLANRAKSLDYFLSQVGRRIESRSPTDPFQVLIILSPPMAFSKDVRLHPIEASGKSNTLIFYIRCAADFQIDAPPRSVPLGRDRPTVTDLRAMSVDDDLERTLRPLKPHQFDVYLPIDFRRVLATILSTIEREAH